MNVNLETLLDKMAQDNGYHANDRSYVVLGWRECAQTVFDFIDEMRDKHPELTVGEVEDRLIARLGVDKRK